MRAGDGDQSGAAYDTEIRPADGSSLLVSQVQNTLLKEGRIGSSIPLVAKMSQGEVVTFAGRAAERMRRDGATVIMEGRAQTLDYVRTPHRFHLRRPDAIR